MLQLIIKSIASRKTWWHQPPTSVKASTNFHIDRRVTKLLLLTHIIEWRLHGCHHPGFQRLRVNVLHCYKPLDSTFKIMNINRMWANAQRDGRPAEHRWRPLFNAAKFDWRPLVPCSNAAKTPHPLKFAGVPQTNQTVSAASGPKFTILCGHVEEILLLNKFFFRLSIHALVAKIQPDKVVRWCAYGDFLRNFCLLYFQRAACSTFQTCILNLH